MYKKTCCSLALSLIALPIAHASSEEDALMKAFGDEAFISIATGSRQPITLAPAVASVITARDIREMGARDLDEILETIPGIHVSVAPRGYLPLYTMRGIYSENNPQVLMLINDIPITNVYVGNRGEVWGGMPVNDIERIEIIRGPGSAIHGADAFAGTINIITKTAQDIVGTQFGVRAGSFSTREGWILQGSTWNDTSIAMSLQFMRTDGHREIIDRDAQTYFDSLSPPEFPDASLAPGPVDLDRKNIDARIDLSHGDWRLRLGYQGRSGGVGAGVALALDPDGKGESDRYNADLSYNTVLSQHWDFTGSISYFDTSAETDLVLFPPGYLSPGGPFPDGVIAQPDVFERHTRINLSTFYHGLDNHSLRFGLGGIHSDMYKIRERKNYVLTEFGPIPLGSLQDVSNDPGNVFIQPQDRKVYYVFAQDEWQMATNWRLTGGVRYDHYSDFGDTTNPRLALVWQPRFDFTTKFLYGRAFRAPAFNELYNINNPVAIGNSDLKPETIDTYEIAFNHQINHRLQAGLNLFHYQMSDVIRFSTLTSEAENSGEIEGNGLEIESTYRVSPGFHITGNYSYQRAVESLDLNSSSRVANVPLHQIYFRGNWAFHSDWSLNAQVNWVADRARESSDLRDPVDDYVVADLTMRYKPASRSWELAVSGRNIFDEDAREPSPRLSPVDGTTPFIPNDLPLAGRHFFAEARYHFDRP